MDKNSDRTSIKPDLSQTFQTVRVCVCVGDQLVMSFQTSDSSLCVCVCVCVREGVCVCVWVGICESVCGWECVCESGCVGVWKCGSVVW